MTIQENIIEQNYIEKSIIKFLRFLIAMIALAIWFVIGMFFWIAILARAMTIFSIAIMAYTFCHQEPKAGLRDPLEIAISFYPAGFRKTLNAIFEQQKPEKPTANKDPDRGTFFKELGYIIAFWASVLVMYGIAHTFLGL